MSLNECSFNLKKVKDGGKSNETQAKFPQWNIVQDGVTFGKVVFRKGFKMFLLGLET
jgi:hypothetical protein